MFSIRSVRSISCISPISTGRSVTPQHLSDSIHKFGRPTIFTSARQHTHHQYHLREDQHQRLLKVGGTSLVQRSLVTVTKTSTTSPSSSTVEVVQSQSSTATIEPSSQLTIQDNDAVTITPSAVQQINRLAKNKNPDDTSNVYLRVYVDAGGCSGFQYKFELELKDDGEIDPEEDVMFQVSLSDESLSATIVIDEGSLEYIQGSTVDFVQEMVRSSFAIVNNPLSESACGCGSSFAVKNFESNPALD